MEQKFLNELPSAHELKKICKGRAVLDLLICGHEFEVYHQYFRGKAGSDDDSESASDGVEAIWGMEFVDEFGSYISMYFCEDGCLIVPSAQIPEVSYDENLLSRKIPREFKNYFNKNFSNSDIPFVIWSLHNKPWHYEEAFAPSEEIVQLKHLSIDPQLYIDWALDFFSEDTYVKEDMNPETIKEIYKGEVLTEDMVFDIVSDVWDWRDIEEELDNIPYRFDF